MIGNKFLTLCLMQVSCASKSMPLEDIKYNFQRDPQYSNILSEEEAFLKADNIAQAKMYGMQLRSKMNLSKYNEVWRAYDDGCAKTSPKKVTFFIEEPTIFPDNIWLTEESVRLSETESEKNMNQFFNCVQNLLAP